MMRTSVSLLLAALVFAGCRHRPAPPPPVPPAPVAREVCGNCKDDDADGRTDFEDAACCPHPVALQGQLALQPATPPGTGDAFTLTARIPAGAFASPNPLLDDVTIQLRDGAQEIVCAQIGHEFWRKLGDDYRFRPRDGRMRNLPQTIVRVMPNGEIAVHAAGLRKGLAPHADAEWHVTIRIGDGCAAGSVRAGASR